MYKQTYLLELLLDCFTIYKYTDTNEIRVYLFTQSLSCCLTYEILSSQILEHNYIIKNILHSTLDDTLIENMLWRHGVWLV